MDATNHLQIFRSARLLSPVLDSRLPMEHLDAVEVNVSEPDALDRRCQYHTANDARVPAYDHAARLLAELLSPEIDRKRTARQRASAIGQLLHYAADGIIPPGARGRSILNQAVCMNCNDVLLFRSARPLAEPFGTSLRQRSDESLWSDGNADAASTAFRLAVDLTLDVAAALPLAAGASAAADAGPALLLPGLVLRELDTGLRVPKLLLPDVHIVEWASHTDTKNGSTVRALFLNNLDVCVGEIFFQGAEWVGRVAVNLPPHSVRAVEFKGPSETPIDLSGGSLIGSCAGFQAPPDAHLIKKRLLGPILSANARFDGVQQVTIPATPIEDILPLVESRRALGGVRLESMQWVPATFGANCRFGFRNVSERKPGALGLDIQIVGQKTGEELIRRQMKVDVSSLSLDTAKAFDVSVAAQARKAVSRFFRIVGITRVAAGRDGGPAKLGGM